MTTLYTGPFRYSTAISDTVAGTFRDIFSITGSANSIVHVMSIGVCSIQTNDEFNLWLLSKRSTANTGGTSEVSVDVALNSNYPDASARVVLYTAPPTYGTLAGFLWSGNVMSNDATPTNDVAGFSGITLNFLDLFGGPIDLLSAQESIGFGLNNIAAPAGMAVSAWVSWFETPKT